MSTQSITPDIVTAFIYGPHTARAECTCGWQARRRWTRGVAGLDALIHSANTGCLTGDPLAVYSDRPIEPRRGARLAVGSLLAASAVIGGALYLSAPASADVVDDYAAINQEVICQTIAEYPYVSTVVVVVEAITEHSGLGPEFAGAVVGTAVRDYCPWNRGTVQRFIATYLPVQSMAPAPASAPAPVTGGVGGRI
jgi:hypothetical protein